MRKSEKVPVSPTRSRIYSQDFLVLLVKQKIQFKIMKKNETDVPIGRNVTKLLLVMKLTVVLTFLFSVSVFAGTYGQSAKVSVSAENKAVKEILKQIEEKSDYYFFYKTEKIEELGLKSVKFKNASIDEILKELLGDSKFSYKVVGNYIAINEKELSGVKAAQPESISGSITDQTGEPLPGVSVVVKGTTVGITSDFDGNYKLDIPADVTADVLVFSFVGMRTQEIVIGGQTVINVKMAEDAVGLEEVVAIGYGTKKKMNLTGAVASVSAKELGSRSITNASTAIAGKVSGVLINQNTGVPGADGGTIRIRGVGTLNDSNPLILIDGIEGVMSDVNPNDIESYSVLKDAASAAIYGSRAANGVILITTKRGKKGKVRVNYTGYYGMMSATKLPDMVNNSVEFMELRNETDINSGLSATFAQEEIDLWANATDRTKYPNTDWVDVLWGSAPVQQHNVTFNGGEGKTMYNFSLGYLDQEGIAKGFDYKRYNMRLNLDTKISDEFNWGVNIAASRGDQNRAKAGDHEMILRTLKSAPMVLPKDDQGRYGAMPNSVLPNASGTPNPLLDAETSTRNSVTDRATFSLFAELELIKDLKLKGTYGLKYVNRNDDDFTVATPTWDLVSGEMQPFNAINTVTNKNTNSLNQTFFSTLSYKKQLEDHALSGMVGFNQESYRSDWFSAKKAGQPNDATGELNAGSEQDLAKGSGAEWSLRSVFGRVNYDYKSKYLFEANFRYDGSSRFADGNRWGFFPSFSAAWRVTEESFMENVSWIDNLKIRASWGELGNQNIGNYASIQNIDLGQYYSFNDALVQGTAINSIANPDITWESTTTTDIGLDLGFVNNKLSVVADYYCRYTRDMLLRVSIPYSVGDVEAPMQNMGEMKNTGIELAVDWRDTKGAFSYGVNVNATYMKNVVEKLDKEYTGTYLQREGEAMNSIFLLNNVGVYQTQEEIDQHLPNRTNYNPAPGDLKYEDFNDDGNITEEDYQIMGKSNPSWMYGLNLDASYKGFDARVFFQGMADFESFLSFQYVEPYFNNSGLATFWRDRWTPENPSKTMPRLTYSSYAPNTSAAYPSTFYMYDRSFIRLKNVQIGYTLPKELTRKAFMQKVRFYLNAENLVTWTNFKGLDPERYETQERFGVFPVAKTVSMGVEITF
ncbi:SusC/RagA family TonB-linked outer membrane protein [Puteibacter caeruleilacunae]|nr:SusC/RagA family TonB-linked outer membrane protein [Puteibacter caeruleilacunae]